MNNYPKLDKNLQQIKSDLSELDQILTKYKTDMDNSLYTSIKGEVNELRSKYQQFYQTYEKYQEEIPAGKKELKRFDKKVKGISKKSRALKVVTSRYLKQLKIELLNLK